MMPVLAALEFTITLPTLPTDRPLVEDSPISYGVAP
jgi:hypothetical protein